MPEELHAEAILRKLAEIRNTLPTTEHRPTERRAGELTRGMHGEPLRTLADFECAAVAAAVAELAADIEFIVARETEEAKRRALERYYAAEELARDPAYADLIPYLEEMRREFEQDYGVPIPEKKRG